MRIYNGFVRFMSNIGKQEELDLSVFADNTENAKEMMYEQANMLGIKYKQMIGCVIRE